MAWEFIDWGQVDDAPAGASDVREPEAGNMVLRVTDVESDEANMRLWLVVDVAEGPQAGFYATEFYADKPYAHRMMVSMKNLGFAKRKLQALTDSNPGFDALAAIRDPRLYVGKLLGAGVGLEERENRTSGKRYWVHDFFHASLGTAADARAGKLKVPEDRPMEEPPSTSMGGTILDYSTADIPF